MGRSRLIMRVASLAAVLLLAAPVAAQQTADLATLTSIGLQDSGGDVVLELAATTRPNCADFTITEPPTLVVNCAGMTMGSVEPVMSVGNGVVEKIEVSESSDASGTNTEIRVYLTSLIGYDAATTGQAVSITLHSAGDDSGGTSAEEEAIAAAMAEADPVYSSGGSDVDLRIESTRTGELSSVAGDHAYSSASVQIRGVDFQQKLESSVSRIVITGSRSLDYSTAYPSDARMVIALRGATLGSGLERRLDTSQFASAVVGISAFRSRQVSGEVKVVVDLREAVTPTITERDEILIIDFPIPPSIAGAAYQAPEVIEPTVELEPDYDVLAADEPIESAIGRERLISAGGDVSDPAKVARRRVKSVLPTDEGIFLGEIDNSHQWTGFPLNLNLVNANIHNVFRLISAVSKLNIVTSDDVTGSVTVQLNEVPWDQALVAILQAKGLGAVQYGNIVRVAPIGTIRKEREDAAATKEAEIDSLPLRVLTLPLNYANARAVMDQLTEMLSRRGSVAYDDRTNSLIVRDIDRNLSQVRQLVKALDTRTPQVHIEARIVEASNSFSRALGIQWGGNLNFSPATGAPTGLFFPNDIGLSGGNTASTVSSSSSTIGGRPSNFTSVPNYVVDLPSASSNGSIGMSFGSISGIINLDARLTAGETNGTSKIISAPSITTVTNRPASIRDGARIPFETASLRGTNVQFVEAVLLLEVTPQITADGTIFLDIQLTKNRPDFGQAIGNLPTIQIKEASTTVMVADGDTTVIGGVYNYETSINRDFVPGLGKIPVLGWLFKRTSKREDRRELLVFITPTIVQSLR
jgi:type IV pilus assembly protein PilQ